MVVRNDDIMLMVCSIAGTVCFDDLRFGVSRVQADAKGCAGAADQLDYEGKVNDS
jgi:hypothetical protein